MMKAPTEYLERWIDQIPPGRVLDIGAGDGEATQFLARRGFSVDAIERDPHNCERLQRLCQDLDVMVHQVAIQDYAFPDQGYTLILASAVLHFLRPTTLWVLADQLVSSIALGGYLIGEVFTTDDPGLERMRDGEVEEIEPNTFMFCSDTDVVHYFTPGELARIFYTLTILEYEEERRLDPQDSAGFRSGAAIVARKD